MMTRQWTLCRASGKTLHFAAALLALTGCSPNPATGQAQFTALMSPAQEMAEGAEGHQRIAASIGVLPSGDPVSLYVTEVGRRITAQTERPDISCNFFVLDSAAVNAFTLPGGYIYVTRGLLALANDEAELAAVLAHETGHVAARHAAERYSEGMLTAMGAAVLAGAAGGGGAARMADLGSGLLVQSYSRGQESQADELGIRYLARAGYDPLAMARFLETLEIYDDRERRRDGRKDDGFSFFATHPRTADRVKNARALAVPYPAKPAGITARPAYLKMLDGLTWGDGAQQGFFRDHAFWHPGMGFTFAVPESFTVRNEPNRVIATAPGGVTVVLDSTMAAGDPAAYLKASWMKEDGLEAQAVAINGLPAAMASFPAAMGSRQITVKLYAIAWEAGQMLRFQASAPADRAAAVDSLAKSLRRMTPEEKQSRRPQRVRIVTAGAGDSAIKFGHGDAELFRILNGLKPGEEAMPGRTYKIIE